MTQAKNFEQIRAQYLRDLQNQNPAAHVHVGSDNHVRASAFAALAEGQYQHQEWILRQAFADTADSTYLEKHAAIFGIYRKQAVAAAGKVKISGRSGSIIPAGTTVRAGSSDYITLSESVVGNDSVTLIDVIANQLGSSSNLDKPTAAKLISAPAGVSADAEILLMAGGSDTETDEELLSRYLLRLRKPPAGGNRNDYYAWALEVPGVANAFVYPLRRGLGTVDVIIVADTGLPSEQVVAATQSYIDSVRPVTAKNVLVAAPRVRTVDVSVKIKLDASQQKETVSALLNEAVAHYFSNLIPGQTLVKSQLESVISQTLGIVDRDLNAPVENINPEIDGAGVEWLRLGKLDIEQMP